MNETQTHWRKCSSCKKEINFSAIYQKCSVSSCRKTVYCSVNCWNLHVPVMNHKSAWAEEERAPKRGAQTDKPRRRIVAKSASKASASPTSKEILVVASKLKAYVKAKHDLNTSASTMEALSDIIRLCSDIAADSARSEGRKTLMDRDFKNIKF